VVHHEFLKRDTKIEDFAIPQSDYLACFEDWKKPWHRCISSGGDYFEGDKIHLEEEIKIFSFIFHS